jgi:hypothetical protein
MFPVVFHVQFVPGDGAIQQSMPELSTCRGSTIR